MKEKTKGFIAVIIFKLSIIIIFSSIIGSILYVGGYGLHKLIYVPQQEENCQRYVDYGYMAELDEDYDCYIYMKDGTKIASRDFNIADYKEPIKVNEG